MTLIILCLVTAQTALATNSYWSNTIPNPASPFYTGRETYQATYEQNEETDENMERLPMRGTEYVATLPAIIIEQGVDVKKAIQALYAFNPVDLQGLSQLIITNRKAYNCGGVGNQCWGEFKYKRSGHQIILYDADAQLSTDEGILLKNTLLHELGHLWSAHKGERPNMYGKLDEENADKEAVQLHYCDHFAKLIN